MKQSNGRTIGIIILIICIIASSFGTGFGVVQLVGGTGDEGASLETTNQVILEGDGTEIVGSAEDAYNYLVENADTFGITNPEETLIFDEESEALNYKYYDFGQVYDGIPVYGNKLIVMTDSEGTVLMSNGVYEDIDEDIDLNPEVTEEQLISGIETYLVEVYGFSDVKNVMIRNSVTEADLVIYAQDGELADVLAYEYDVTFSHTDGSDDFQVIADADSGEVLNAWSNIVFESETVEVEDLSSNKVDINVYNDAGKYYMYDDARNIAIYDANELEVSPFFLEDKSSTVNWRNAQNMVFEGNIPKLGNSNSSTSWDAEAVTLMKNIAINYDWYKKHLNMTGWDNKSGLTLAYYDDVYDKYKDGTPYGNNAYSCSKHDWPYMFLSFGYEKDVSVMDLIAHEYAHSVQKGVYSLQYQGETGAIMEAYADVMGEIVEADSSWYHSSGRNLANPHDTKDPAKVGDQYYGDPTVLSKDKGSVHQNNTIFAHASYLMYIGMNNDNSMKLNCDMIARLWHLTNNNLTHYNTDFQEFGYLMKVTAKSMLKTNAMSEKQYACVCKALDQVGVMPENNISIVNNKFTLLVRDINGQPLNDATMCVNKVHFENNVQKMVEVQNKKIGDTGIVDMSLDDGYFYCLEIKDDKYTDSKVNRFYIFCQKDVEITNHTITTDFRNNIVRGFKFQETEFNVAINEKKYIETQIAPKGISDEHYEITWASSDETKVAIDEQTGQMTGIAEGTATVSATLTNRGNTFTQEATVTVTQKQRDTILVLDCSGSMRGTPLTEMKQSAINFCNDLLNNDGDNQVEIITYESDVQRSGFFSDFYEAQNYINNIDDQGMTNMYDALELADEELETYARKNSIKNVVIMSDGIPNKGNTISSGVMTNWANNNNYGYSYSSAAKYGNAVCSMADTLKRKYNVYSLGFFHELYDEDRAYCNYLMNYIQNSGYYEVEEAENLQFIFGDISDEVSNGSKIVVQIACPVDVTVTYEGETLSSSYVNYNEETSFGTLRLAGVENEIKVLELDSDKEYQISLQGNGAGTMDYSVTYYDEKDTITDTRRFDDVPITVNTDISTNTNQSVVTELNIDSNGDGEADSIWTADANSEGKETWKDENTKEEKIEIPETTEETKEGMDMKWLILIIVCAVILIASVVVLIVLLRSNNKNENEFSDYSIIPEQKEVQRVEQSERSEIKESKTESQTNVSKNVSNDLNDQQAIKDGILILDGMMQGIKIALKDNDMLNVGKDPKLASLVIEKRFTSVSRLHCTIVYSKQHNKYFVTDCSSNGTYLNSGTRLQKGKRTPVNRQTILYLANRDCKIKLL